MLSRAPAGTQQRGSGGKSRSKGACAVFAAGGNGTSETPYLIATPEQLFYAVAQINAGTDNTKAFKLTADIDVAGQEWTPIGNNTNKFMRKSIFYSKFLLI